eukprot:scpid37081/ scgid5936/ 
MTSDWYGYCCQTQPYLSVLERKFHLISSPPSEPPKVTLSLSPVVFVIYLESALREIRASIPPRPMRDMALPPEVIYADDTDFISQSRPWLESIEPDIIAILGDWHLKINKDKTEKNNIAPGRRPPG